jgi:hypothetical protein
LAEVVLEKEKLEKALSLQNSPAHTGEEELAQEITSLKQRNAQLAERHEADVIEISKLKFSQNVAQGLLKRHLEGQEGFRLNLVKELEESKRVNEQQQIEIKTLKELIRSKPATFLDGTNQLIAASASFSPSDMPENITYEHEPEDKVAQPIKVVMIPSNLNSLAEFSSQTALPLHMEPDQTSISTTAVSLSVKSEQEYEWCCHFHKYLDMVIPKFTFYKSRMEKDE